MLRRHVPASRRWFPWPIAAACVLLGLLTSCAGPGGGPAGRFAAYRHDYPPPGPPSDPWGPYIREAALRFGIPEGWVRAVMRQESGGREDATSPAGAMGLMQVMPDTYAMLSARYGLGGNPYEPHDNIMAGAAYVRELYDRYGAPGFLAAYNAGPKRLDAYLDDGTPLPNETVSYLSSVAPELGAGTPMSGPLAVFAGNAGAAGAQPVVLAEARTGTCNPDAAYDPARPCAPAPAPAVAPRPVEVAALPAPEPAPYRPPAPLPYSPPRPRSVLPPLVYSPAPRPAPRVQLASLSSAPLPRGWSIQVGAFESPATAQAAAEHALRALPDLLGAGRVRAPSTTPFGGTVLYRARVVSLSHASAAAACARLTANGRACMAVPPGR